MSEQRVDNVNGPLSAFVLISALGGVRGLRWAWGRRRIGGTMRTTGDLANLILVSERFVGFVNRSDTSTVHRFISAIRRGEYDDITTLRLVAGQGIDDDDLTEIRLALRERGLLDRVLLNPGTARPEPARLVHKEDNDNVMIAGLRVTGDGGYEATLRLTDRNELLLDHVAGGHVPGMVLIEASRQMILAVTERYILPTLPAKQWGFLLCGLNTTFERYAFPVDAGIRLELEALPGTTPTRPMFEVVVTIRQAGQVVTQCRAEYRLHDSRVLARQEDAIAAQVIDDVCVSAGVITEPALGLDVERTPVMADV